MPPRNPKRWLNQIKVNEVSLVDEGDNPAAQVLVYKHRLRKQPTADAVHSDAPLGEEDDRRRRGRPRRGRGTVDGHNRTAKLDDGRAGRTSMADTSKQDQDFKTEGGTRFGRNAYALNSGNPSEWKLRLYDSQADADANRPSIRLTAAAAQALGPSGFRGQRVQLPGGARSRVISRVRAAWMRARRQADQDVSREDLPAVLKRSLLARIADAFYEWGGLGSPDEELEKRLFDEIRAESMNQQIAEALLSRVHDLGRSVREALFSEDEEREPQAAIAESLKQFSDAMDGDLAEIFAGRIVKAIEEVEGDDEPDEETVEKVLTDLFTVDTTQADDVGATKEESMDLSKLSTEDRDKVQAALDAAGSVEEFTKNMKSLAELVTKASAAETELAKLKGNKEGKDDEDPFKDLPEPVRKVIDERVGALSKENTTLKGRLDDLEKARKREAFEKSVGNLTGLPEKREKLIDALWGIEDEGQRDTMQKNLEAAAEAVRRGNLFGELGSDLSDGGSAYAKIVAKAAEIRKAKPDLTEAQARAEALNQSPELYDAYLEETQATVN